MSRPTEEQLFERYRHQGDVEALGEVFDRTAPALLRVALHVARDPLAAEDLVQATFLKAIESASDGSADRPIVSWLVGILRHQGQQARWRDGRTPDPTRMGCPITHDPEANVQERELTKAQKPWTRPSPTFPSSTDPCSECVSDTVTIQPRSPTHWTDRRQRSEVSSPAAWSCFERSCPLDSQPRRLASHCFPGEVSQPSRPRCRRWRQRIVRPHPSYPFQLES